MRLFGEQGYAATSVAQIEEAAGLRPGAGGLYAHYRSKEALLREGLETLLTAGTDRAEAEGAEPLESGPSIGDRYGQSGNDDSQPPARAALVGELEAMMRAGLARLEHDRDYNRILVRDLRALPDLLQMSADREIRPAHEQLEVYLASPRFRLPGGVTPRALAAALIGATSHFWLLTDVFGAHPAGVGEDEYVSTLAHLTAALVAEEEES